MGEKPVEPASVTSVVAMLENLAREIDPGAWVDYPPGSQDPLFLKKLVDRKQKSIRAAHARLAELRAAKKT